jgi:hypothetical protein
MTRYKVLYESQLTQVRVTSHKFARDDRTLIHANNEYTSMTIGGASRSIRSGGRY